jgi:SAM-dependent methyltransferase
MPEARGDGVTAHPGQGELPRLYRDLADWYPLLTPVADYAEAAAFYRRLFEAHCRRLPRTLLDLGSGGGHNVAHLKATLTCTLVDLAPAMLEMSRRLNPECEHVQGDIRSIRLGRGFDCVLVHDAGEPISPPSAGREDQPERHGGARGHEDDEVGRLEAAAVADAEVLAARHLPAVECQRGLAIAPALHDERHALDRRVGARGERESERLRRGGR